MVDHDERTVRDRRQSLLRILARTGSARLVDLAAELEVSIATIRRDVTALHQLGRITRRRGVAVLEGGDGPHRGRAPTIGVIVATNRYLLLIADAVRREARRLHLLCLVRVADSSTAARQAHRELLAAGCVGIVYAPGWATPAEVEAPVPWLVESPVPIVLAGRAVEIDHPLFGLDSVIADHRWAMRLAVEHLHGLGHRRILASVRERTPPTQLLKATFLSELDRLAMPVVAAPASTPSGTNAYTDFDELITLIDRTAATGIIVHTDDAAQRLAQRVRQRGGRIPAELSVIGYDDIVGPVDQLALTSVSPPKHELATEAMALLLRRHSRAVVGVSAPPAAHVQLLPELVVRASTAPPDVSAVRSAPDQS